jgi:hypothetical protein
MMFWIAILSGALFVWLAVRMGFYDTWVLFFNIVVSVYVSVFLAPVLAELVPPPGGAAAYHVALCMIVLAGGSFAVLQGLSFVFLTGQFSIPFPRTFDVLLSGLLGFVAGFLVLSFASLVLTTTPLAGHRIVGVFALGRQSRQANLFCITRCCDMIHSFAGPDDGGNATSTAVQKLLDLKIANAEPAKRPPEANEPPVTGPAKDVTSRPLPRRSLSIPE